MRTLQLSCILVALCLATSIARAEVWPPESARPLMGTAQKQAAGLSLRPNPAGQILLELPHRQLSLDEHPRVRLQFDDAPPVQVYLIWRNNRDETQLYQYKHLPMGNPEPVIDMAENANWKGEARLLQLGFRGEPGKSVKYLGLEIYRPGLWDHAQDLWHNWASFYGWRPVDINLYTGTRDFDIGPHPTPAFAAMAVLALLAYLLFARRKSTWTGVGLVLFCAWLALDSLWQLRLWRQVNLTHSTFADASNDEKPALTDSEDVSKLAQKVRESIRDPQARVFIATVSDAAGMNAAYYISPLNAYWHRRGPELPELDAIRPGNYILVVRPSGIRLNREKTLIVDRSGKQLSVSPLYEDRTGLLLKVLP